MSNIDKRAFAITKELATLMVERFSMNPVSSKLLNEAWQKEFPDEVAIAARMLALLDELEAKDRRIEEEIGRANREHHRGFMMACGHLKEHSNIHYADAAEMEIAALRKRINELENAAADKGE
ncbi:TPA: ead/Ea22-like family protein [Enterobacter cloacae]|nr:ead/Ea22-like family protein [Enterobacter cloacae]HCJ0088637.1 ead/Ea22-like family protein [Enterobacter cloacae]